MKKFFFVLVLMMSLFSFANAIEFKPYVGFDVGYNNVKNKKLTKSIQDEHFFDLSSIYPFGDYEFHNYAFGKIDNDKIYDYSINLGLKSYFDNKSFININAYYRFGSLIDETINSIITSREFDPFDNFALYKDEVELKNNYGIQISVGYDFSDKFGGFVSYGINNFDFDFKSTMSYPFALREDMLQLFQLLNMNLVEILGTSPYYKSSYSKSKFNNSLGFGFNYELNKNVEFIFAYEYTFVKNYIFSNKLIRGINATKETVMKFDNIQTFRLGVNYLF